MLSSLQVILLYILWLYLPTYLPTSTLIWFDLKHAVRKAFCSWSNQTFSWSMMAIQTGAISCAHIFSCAGSVQASDLSHTYLLAAGQVKEHCRLSNTVMCHGVAKSNGRPTRNLTRTREREKIWLKWAGPDKLGLGDDITWKIKSPFCYLEYIGSKSPFGGIYIGRSQPTWTEPMRNRVTLFYLWEESQRSPGHRRVGPVPHVSVEGRLVLPGLLAAAGTDPTAGCAYFESEAHSASDHNETRAWQSTAPACPPTLHTYSVFF